MTNRYVESGASITLQLETAKLTDQAPPKNITRVYHYTTLAGWEKIQKTGTLNPMTLGYGRDFLIPAVNDLIAKNKGVYERKYIVGGVDSPNFQPWRDFGLHNILLEHISNDGKDNIVLLSFPAKVVRGALIRDHGHSPRIDKASTPNKEERIRMVREQTVRYYALMVRAAEYDGSFKVPEIWIPHPVSISDITVEKIGKVADFR